MDKLGTVCTLKETAPVTLQNSGRVDEFYVDNESNEHALTESNVSICCVVLSLLASPACGRAFPGRCLGPNRPGDTDVLCRGLIVRGRSTPAPR